ncbi:LamG domain-containing protein [Candidatus Micrarchaeota archaeon]|nr:LamG domain-containing protein [Candidatus Micrarchaeota archaeon]
MKKAFLFTVVFVLIFTTLILLSVFYLRMMQMNELDLTQSKNITRILYVRDDLATDILSYLQLSVSIQSNSTNTILNISDTLPSPYSDPGTALNTTYAGFINGTYSNQTNLLDPATNLSVISLNITAFQSAPSLQFINSNPSLNLNYSYNNLSKNELIINGSSLVTNYSVTIALNDTCLNSNCTNATWAGGPPNIDSSTVGMWHFDEGGSNTTTNDSSGNGNTGTLHGATWNFSGKYGKALQFDGSSSYVDCGSNSYLKFNLTNNFTVEAWVNPALDSNDRVIVGNAWNSPGYHLRITSANKARFILVKSGSDYNYSETAVLSTGWHHIAGTWDGTTVTIYLDGVLDSTTGSSGTLDNMVSTYNLTIGNLQGQAKYFQGTIDEVAIYNRTKPADEIAADANLFHWDWSPTAMNSNLSAVWHFDEGGGTNTSDSSGSGNTATLYGTTTWNSSGKSGYALNFDGSTAYAEALYSSSLDVNNFTVEAWILSRSNTQASGGGCAKVIAKNKTAGVCGSTYPYGIQDDCTTNRIMAYIYTSSIYSVTGPVWSTFLGWTHVAMVYNGTNLTLYVNGSLYNSTAATGALCANTMSLLIGGRTSQFFNGTIDDVAIYSRAKSAAEIAADANPIYVSINLTDSLGNPVSIRGSTSGYVNPGANNTAYIQTSNGNLNMTAGAYSGFYSLRVYANNTKASMLTNIIESGVSSIQAIIPIQLTVYQQTFSNLVIAEK